MRIVTFNVNGFRGLLNQGESIDGEASCNNLQKLKDYIDGLKINAEDVVILQEIPHMYLVDKSVTPWIWEHQEMFHKFVSMFRNDYKIIYPRYLIDSKQCTVAIVSKNSQWKEAKSALIRYNRFRHYGNKLIEIENGNAALLGVHMNPCDEMWDMVINSLKKKKVNYVVGDFNAYEERGEMRLKPGVLRGLGYNSFIPSSVITDYKDCSSIDNFYVDNDFILKAGMSIEVKKTEDFISDHACCTLTI